MKQYPMEEAAQSSGVDREKILRFIAYEWIVPRDRSRELLDEEDIARAHLIRELQEEFGVNDAAVPIILHLIDELNCIQVKLRSGRFDQ